MKNARKCLSIISVICLIFFGLTPLPANATDKTEVLRKARQSYYNLHTQGLQQFRCQVVPDWKTLFESAKADPAAVQQVLPFLLKTHYSVAVGPEGAATITHDSDETPPSEEIGQRANQTMGGIDQVINGFFQTWSQFVVNVPLPEPEAAFELEDVAGSYRVTYKEGSTTIVNVMSHDFVIDQMQVTTPDISGTLQTTFLHDKNGLLLSGYTGNFKNPVGAAFDVTVKIEYQLVEGFNLPATVVATSPGPNGPVSIALKFSSYQLTKP